MAVSYQRRVVDELLDDLCSELPAVVLRGARAVGKSATATQRAKTIYSLDDPQALRIVKADPDVLVTGETPILIDEWQKWPESWDRIRHAVDDDPSPNRFILAASAEPPEQPSHSGAGRIVVLQMRPMSLAERGLGDAAVSLGTLLTGDRDDITGSRSELTLADYAEEITRSGFPAIRNLSQRARRRQLLGYLEHTFSYAITEEGSGVSRHDPGSLRRWARSYAAATATTTSYETIRDGATPGEEEKPARGRAAAIRNTLERSYVLDPLEAWLPTFSKLGQLGKAVKHHLVDPALAAAMLGVDAVALAKVDGPPQFVAKQRPLVAAFFESLVAQSVRVYAEHNDASAYHLRTHRGEREIDVIVERDDGGVVAIEVKLTATPDDDDFEHLSWLERRIGDRLLDAAIVTTGRYAYRDPDTGFAVLPAALLGP